MPHATSNRGKLFNSRIPNTRYHPRAHFRMHVVGINNFSRLISHLEPRMLCGAVPRIVPRSLDIIFLVFSFLFLFLFPYISFSVRVRLPLLSGAVVLSPLFSSLCVQPRLCSVFFVSVIVVLREIESNRFSKTFSLFFFFFWFSFRMRAAS